MRSRKLASALSLMGAFLLLVAACAPAATPTPTATPTPPPIVATPTPAPGAATPTPVAGVATPTPAPIVATPTPLAGMPVGYGYSPFGEWGMPLNMPPAQYGGVYRDAQSGSPALFDSQRQYASNPVRATALVFDSLIRFSPYLDLDIIPGTYELQHLGPSLAEKWEVSGDGMLVTFYLKKEVKWHDGKPFTAKDVKYSMDKLLDPARSVWSADLIMVDRAEVVDDHTLRVYFKFPAVRLFLFIMAMSQVAIQPAHLKEVSNRSPDFLVGTGAFKFVSHTAGIEFVTRKNTDYHFKGRPYFDGVSVKIFATGSAALEALAAGQIDFYEWTRAESEIAILKRAAPEVTIRNNKKFIAFYLTFVSFVKEGPWQDVRVRKAMAMVMDRVSLCLGQWGASRFAEGMCLPEGGYFATPATGWGLPFAEYEKAWLLNRPIEERVAVAKKLLADAGYPNGFKVKSLGYGGQLLDWEFVAWDLWKKHLNVEVEGEIVPRALEVERRLAGEFAIQTATAAPMVQTMEQFVNQRFISGGSTNYGKYVHPLVEKLYEQLMREPDLKKANELLKQIERLLIEDVPNIPMYAWHHSYGYWPYLAPKHFSHPMYLSHYTSQFTITWFDKNHPTWSKRAK